MKVPTRNSVEEARILNKIIFGQRVKALREELRLSGKALADLVGVSPQYISQIEHGRANPSKQFFMAMSTALHLTEEWLTTGEGEKFSDPSLQITHHSDTWLQSFLETLVRYWLSSTARQQWVVANTLSSMFGATMHTWMTARNPPLEPHELKNVPNLDNLLDEKLMAQLREVSPALADKMRDIVSSLLLATVQDYCDFLKAWWDAATDDERTWARVELKRRLPMLF